MALSPDGKSALARRGSQTVLLPTGDGQVVPVSANAVAFDDGGTFLPDGRLLLAGSSPGHTSRLFVFQPAGGETHPVSSDSVTLPMWIHAVSPDGKSAAAVGKDGAWAIFPTDVSDVLPRAIQGLRDGEAPIRWSADGRSLLVLSDSGLLSRLDPATGRHETVKQFRPWARVLPTPDGRSYVYGYGADFSNLYLIDNLR